MEIVSKNRLQVVDKNSYLASIEMAIVNSKTFSAPPPSNDHKEYVLKNVKISVPLEEKAAYIQLLEKNIDVFLNENDLGCANHYKHKIDKNNKNPINVKLFCIAETYRTGLFEQVKSWLALGIIQPSQSKFNNPIFVVPKNRQT
jgi:hypothetical protein